MPNIMLTYRCNLRCPYCFANEFIGGSSEEITLENFDKAVEFLTRQGAIHLGLIGGEPSTHSRFEELLERVICDQRITTATVYTNGILLNGHTELLAHPKVSLLVNWNPIEQIGAHNFERIRSNIDELIFEHDMRHRLNLGLNLHGESFDYLYMLELLKRYGLHKVRVSITVPDFPQGCDTDIFEYFNGFKPILWKMFHDMDAIGVLPYYDCNRPPYCIWSPEERQWLESYVARYSVDDSSIINTKSFCRPVIDILPNLQAVRCFGLSFLEKVPIEGFATYEDLVVHFMREIDRRAFRIHAGAQCENCPLRRQWLCCQGCMGFKSDTILQLGNSGN